MDSTSHLLSNSNPCGSGSTRTVMVQPSQPDANHLLSNSNSCGSGSARTVVIQPSQSDRSSIDTIAVSQAGTVIQVPVLTSSQRIFLRSLESATQPSKIPRWVVLSLLSFEDKNIVFVFLDTIFVKIPEAQTVPTTSVVMLRPVLKPSGLKRTADGRKNSPNHSTTYLLVQHPLTTDKPVDDASLQQSMNKNRECTYFYQISFPISIKLNRKF